MPLRSAVVEVRLQGTDLCLASSRGVTPAEEGRGLGHRFYGFEHLSDRLRSVVPAGRVGKCGEEAMTTRELVERERRLLYLTLVGLALLFLLA